VRARSEATPLVAIATVVVGLDQFTKSSLVQLMALHQGTLRLDVIDGLVALEYTENRGAAFGIFAGLSPVLPLASIVVLAALLCHYVRDPKPSSSHTIAVGLIAGGALGNLVDRIRLGYVVDFVSVGSWPNFNVADAAITLGVSIWLWGWLRAEAAWGATRVIDQEG
jgi:signal peptidase II